MQTRPVAAQKQKYKLKQFAIAGNYPTNKCSYQSNDSTCKLYCICNQFSLNKSRKCSRCHQSYHSCVASKTPFTTTWQCLHCQSIYMDPIYFPQHVLLETFFKIQPISQCGNLIQFVFFVADEQIKRPIQVRGLQDGRQGLAWPMQGQFYLNKDQHPEPIIDIKPLLKNSNRKHRKQEALFLPEDKVRVGKNILTFEIPKLNLLSFQSKYQSEAKGIYFLGIYSIKKLTKEELIQKTFQTSKVQKAASLQFLKRSSLGFGELSVQKSVICLECPYMKSRIKIPVRGKNCSHYTCICLQTLIQTRTGMNSRQWLCPICNAPINQPVIDMFILSILNDGSAGIKVSLDVDGNYQWITYEEDNVSLSSDSMDMKVVSKKPDAMVQPMKQKQQKPQPETINKVPEKALEKAPERVIQTIDIEDDQPPSQIAPQQLQPAVMRTRPTTSPLIPPPPPPVTTPPPTPIASKSTKPPLYFRQPTQAIKTTVPNRPLQILIPQQKQPQNKKERLQLAKQQLKQDIKEKKKKQTIQNNTFSREYPNKQDFYITDICQLNFRPLTYHQFVKRYFHVEYKRAKIHDQLKVIFKEVV